LESVQRLLGMLGDDEFRKIAVMKMQDHTNAEIARAIGRSEKTVERRLTVIRSKWKDERDAD
jgi:DNA-directed RNA polymerase specialized sigma24 family protein